MEGLEREEAGASASYFKTSVARVAINVAAPPSAKVRQRKLTILALP
jgi:hypothetical protein